MKAYFEDNNFVVDLENEEITVPISTDSVLKKVIIKNANFVFDYHLYIDDLDAFEKVSNE